MSVNADARKLADEALDVLTLVKNTAERGTASQVLVAREIAEISSRLYKMSNLSDLRTKTAFDLLLIEIDELPKAPIIGMGISREIIDVFRHRTEHLPNKIDNNRILNAVRRTGEPLTADAILKGLVLTISYFIGQPAGGVDLDRLLLLDGAVPAQQIAPLQFDIVDEKVVISAAVTDQKFAQNPVVPDAIKQIAGMGTDLLDVLARSNCDSRLSSSVEAIITLVREDAAPVRIGLANMQLGIFAVNYRDELSDGIAAQLVGFHTAVSMLAAQSEEWKEFLSNAADANMETGAVSEIERVIEGIVPMLRASPYVDSEIPITIQFISSFISHPGRESKKAAFAVLKTLENLVAKIVQFNIDLIRKTSVKTVDKASDKLSSFASNLLTIALFAAVGVGASAATVGSPWLIQAAEVLSRSLGINS
jgi:hypothetical protein